MLTLSACGFGKLQGNFSILPFCAGPQVPPIPLFGVCTIPHLLLFCWLKVHTRRHYDSVRIDIVQHLSVSVPPVGFVLFGDKELLVHKLNT